MILIPLPPGRLEAAWPLALPFAEDMARRFPDDWPVAEILRQARRGTLLLWLVFAPQEGRAHGLVGTEVNDKPGGRRVLSVALAAGDALDRSLHLLGTLERHGAAHGCDAVEIRGRPGWARLFPDYRATRDILLRKDFR